MRKSLIQGITEKDMQALMTKLNLNNFYFPSLFPMKFTPTLTWKTLQAEKGIPVAADVVSYNASIPLKSRDIVNRLSGDIPKIAISRVLEETDLNEYRQLLHYANTTEGQRALVEFVYNDMEFCFDGVNARLEWLALQALSNGKITLGANNNNGILTETLVDFLVPTANKKGATAAWDNPATAKPIKDIKAIVKASKLKGQVKVMLMNQNTFDNMRATDEVVKYCASWVLQVTGLEQLPSLESVNAALSKENLPQIVIIDSQVIIEDKDSKRIAVDPWTDGVVTFLPNKIAGNTFYSALADEMVESSPALKVKRGHILLKKFAEENPVKEFTQGLANAFPAWSSAQQSYLLNTKGTTWE